MTPGLRCRRLRCVVSCRVVSCRVVSCHVVSCRFLHRWRCGTLTSVPRCTYAVFTQDYWENSNLLLCHMQWHWALFQLDEGDVDMAFSRFDVEMLGVRFLLQVCVWYVLVHGRLTWCCFVAPDPRFADEQPGGLRWHAVETGAVRV